MVLGVYKGKVVDHVGKLGTYLKLHDMLGIEGVYYIVLR